MTGLNDNYRRRILTSFQYADKLLTESLHALAPGAQPLFSSYAPDLSPSEARWIEGYTRKIREQMARLLDNCGIERSVPSTPSSGKIRTALTSVDLTLEDIYPEKMRGYGKMDAAAAHELSWRLHEIRWLISLLLTFLTEARSAREEGPSLLDSRPDIAASMQRMAQILENHGLVEFLPAHQSITRKARVFGFEIAFFGRPGSGKSSYINRFLGADLLPATSASLDALPLRIAAGSQPGLRVSFMDRTENFPLAQLPEFLPSRENPANSKRVAALEVRAAAQRLKDGFVFIEMPGLGWSLPEANRCADAFLTGSDFALVMVEANAGISMEELGLLRALATAGIPCSVLLTKSDLLPPKDVERAQGHVCRTIAGHQIEVTEVIPVGTDPSRRPAVDAWFERTFPPLLEKARASRIAAIAEDVRALHSSLLASVETRMPAAAVSVQPERKTDEVLRRIDEALTSFHSHWDREVDKLASWSAEILEHAASALAGTPPGAEQPDNSAQDSVAATITRAVAGRFVPFLTDYKNLTARIGADLKQLQAGPYATSLIPWQLPPLFALPMPSSSILAGASITMPGALARRDATARLRHFRKELEDKEAARLRQMMEEFQPRFRRWFQSAMNNLKDSVRLQTAPMRYRSFAPASTSSDETLAADIAFLRAL